MKFRKDCLITMIFTDQMIKNKCPSNHETIDKKDRRKCGGCGKLWSEIELEEPIQPAIELSFEQAKKLGLDFD